MLDTFQCLSWKPVNENNGTTTTTVYISDIKSNVIEFKKSMNIQLAILKAICLYQKELQTTKEIYITASKDYKTYIVSWISN